MDYAEQFKCSLLPDGDDGRDYTQTNIMEMYNKEIKIPSKISFIDKLPPIGNQLTLGSCAHWAFNRIAAVFDPRILFAPMYTYYFTRLAEFGIENIGENKGSTLRGVLKTANKKGWTLEELCRYGVDKLATEPDDISKAYAGNKIKYKRVIYYAISSVDEIKFGMAMGFVPFIGIKITDSFYSEETMKTGLILPPSGKEHGLHGVMSGCFDDDLKNGCNIIDNSWGMSVGDKGRFYLPYDVFPSILSNAWMVKIVDVGLGDADGIAKTII